MRYTIAPYIYPIMVGNDCVGQGFVADGFFITAAHVVKDNPNCYIKIGDHKVMLCNYKYQYGRKVIDAYYIGKGDTYKDPKQIDVALYKFSSSNSSLHLNLHKPKVGEILNSCCVVPAFDTTTYIYHNEFSEENAMVLKAEEGNYFYCECERFCGSCGSPLLWENQVVGIMHGGDDNGLICAFLKIESFIFDIDITVEYDKSEIIRKLLPCGADRTTAIIILYALNIDITIMGIDLVEEGIYETGYYAVLDKLPFKIDELSKVEREVLDEYCTCVVHQTM